MRIGINASCLEGERKGEGRYLSNLLREWLSEPGHDEFILYLRSNAQTDAFLQVSNVKQVVVSSPFRRRMQPGWEHIFLPWRAWRDKIDLFFSPSYTLPVISPFKTAVTQHDISYEALPQDYRWKEKIRLNLFSRRSAKQSDVILAVSEFTKAEIVKYYTVSEGKIVVTHEDCDSQFYPIIDESLLTEFKKGNRLVGHHILFVGTMLKRRRLNSLLDAFTIVAQRISEVQFVLVGSPESVQSEELRRLMSHHSFRDRILRFEYVSDEDLNLLYNTAAVLVYPSVYEGFGLPVLEAMRCGTPVIVSNCASLPEVVGDAGVFANPDDPKDIADKICKVLTDPIWREDLSDRALRQSAKFSWARCARETREAFCRAT